VATIFDNFPENEVTKFSAVFHPTGCFRYTEYLGCRGNNAHRFVQMKKRKAALFLVRGRLVFSQK